MQSYLSFYSMVDFVMMEKSLGSLNPDALQLSLLQNG